MSNMSTHDLLAGDNDVEDSKRRGDPSLLIYRTVHMYVCMFSSFSTSCEAEESSAMSMTADDQAQKRRGLDAFYPEVVYLGCYPRAPKSKSSTVNILRFCRATSPDVFPFAMLPLELRYQVFHWLSLEDFKRLRLLSRYMNNIVLNYWKFAQRSVRTIIVGSCVDLTKWSQENWRVLEGCQYLGMVLRSSRSTRIPCISFNKVRLPKGTFERLITSVAESGVVIDQCEFNNCQFQCGVYDLVKFLEISKVQRLAIIGYAARRPIFTNYLLASAYVKKINVAIISGSNCSTLPLFPHAVFQPKNLKTVLEAWRNGTHSFQFLVVRTKIPVKNNPSTSATPHFDPVKDFPFLQCRRNVYTYFKNEVRMKIKREHNDWLFNCHSVGFINSYLVEHLGYF